MRHVLVERVVRGSSVNVTSLLGSRSRCQRAQSLSLNGSDSVEEGFVRNIRRRVAILGFEQRQAGLGLLTESSELMYFEKEGRFLFEAISSKQYSTIIRPFTAGSSKVDQLARVFISSSNNWGFQNFYSIYRCALRGALALKCHTHGLGQNVASKHQKYLLWLHNNFCLIVPLRLCINYTPMGEKLFFTIFYRTRCTYRRPTRHALNPKISK